MVNLLYSPRWFYGKDILIDVVSIIVLLLIGYCSFRFYRFNKPKKEHFLFSLSFFLLALAFVFKILTNFTLYTHVWKTLQFGLFNLTYQTIYYSDTLLIVGTLISRLLVLLGLYTLYLVYYKEQLKSAIFFMIYFILITTYFSNNAYYLFHFTNFLFLTFIIYKYVQNYHCTQDIPAKFILYSFCLIALSQIGFMFVDLSSLWYVAAELIQLSAYLLLLISFMMVLRYGKKKKPG